MRRTVAKNSRKTREKLAKTDAFGYTLIRFQDRDSKRTEKMLDTFSSPNHKQLIRSYIMTDANIANLPAQANAVQAANFSLQDDKHLLFDCFISNYFLVGLSDDFISWHFDVMNVASQVLPNFISDYLLCRSVAQVVEHKLHLKSSIFELWLEPCFQCDLDHYISRYLAIFIERKANREPLSYQDELENYREEVRLSCEIDDHYPEINLPLLASSNSLCEYAHNYLFASTELEKIIVTNFNPENPSRQKLKILIRYVKEYLRQAFINQIYAVEGVHPEQKGDAVNTFQCLWMIAMVTASIEADIANFIKIKLPKIAAHYYQDVDSIAIESRVVELA